MATAGACKTFDKIILTCKTKAFWKGAPCYTVSTDKPTASTTFKQPNIESFLPKVGNRAWKSEFITVSQ